MLGILLGNKWNIFSGLIVFCESSIKVSHNLKNYIDWKKRGQFIEYAKLCGGDSEKGKGIQMTKNWQWVILSRTWIVLIRMLLSF